MSNSAYSERGLAAMRKRAAVKRKSERPAKLPFVALAMLQEKGPCSCAELGELMGKTREAARNHIHFLSLMVPKVVYISGWKPDLGSGMGSGGPIWAAGNLPDVAKPEPAVRKTKRMRVESTSEYAENRLRTEIQSKAASIRPFRDPMLFLTAGRAA